MAFSRSRFASMTMAGALVLAACGSDGTIDASKGTLAEAETTVAPATTATTVAETTTTVAETTTTVAETTTTTAAVVAGPADGVAFVGPDADYTLLIGPDWVDASSQFGTGIAGWFTGVTSADFAENVNILTDTIPSATPLEAILAASIGELEGQFEGFTLLESEVMTRPGQTDLGVLEYTAVQENIEIRFVQVFGVWNDTLVVFTGSTDGRLGQEGADRLRPYALTLAPPS